MSNKYDKISPHYEYSVRCQLNRWFNQLTTKEMEALKEAFNKSKTQQTRKTK